MVIGSSAGVEFAPIEVLVEDPGGEAIAGAQVRATYTYSGLSSSATTDDDGIASVPLLYCDKEPMRVDAVAPGYHAEAVSEYRPDHELFKLGVKLRPLESDGHQLVVPLRQSDMAGSLRDPVVGKLQVSGKNFHITDAGDVAVNGSVATWNRIEVGKDYGLLKRDGTELTIRFLEIQTGFSVTLEYSGVNCHTSASRKNGLQPVPLEPAVRNPIERGTPTPCSRRILCGSEWVKNGIGQVLPGSLESE